MSSPDPTTATDDTNPTGPRWPMAYTGIALLISPSAAGVYAYLTGQDLWKHALVAFGATTLAAVLTMLTLMLIPSVADRLGLPVVFPSDERERKNERDATAAAFCVIAAAGFVVYVVTDRVEAVIPVWSGIAGWLIAKWLSYHFR